MNDPLEHKENLNSEFKYEIDKSGQMIYVTWDGLFDLEKVNRSLDEMYCDPEYQQEYNGIADVRKAIFAMNIDELRKNHEFVMNHPNGTRGKWAVVCSSPMQTAYAALYKEMSGHHATNVFTTLKVAKRWLGSKSKSP